MTASDIQQLALAAVALIVAITLHEAAHGYAAWALGDQTARLRGRLSLNPLRHVDRVGTILVPAILIIPQWLATGSVGFLFGWAKPVPVDPSVFRSPRRGMALVAAAGPLMNFFLAWVGALALHLVPLLPGSAAAALYEFVALFITSNIVLGLFNLLPIPPLDGGRIMVGILPLPAARAWARLERAGLAIVLLTVFLLPTLLQDVAHVHFDPVRDLLGAVLPRVGRFIVWAAGNGDTDF